jgi:RNase P protein component
VTAIWLPGEAPARVAFAVGRPVGNAVMRNLVTRRLRAAVEALEQAPGQSPDDPSSRLGGGAWLFRVGRDAAHRPYDALRHDLERAVTAAMRR